MRSPYWYMGFFVGILVALGFLLILRKCMGRCKREYDERQKLAQGQAYCAAFWALMGFLALMSLLQLFFGNSWFNPFTLSIFAIVFGVGVYCIVCIVKDAYLPLRETPARFYFTGGIVILVNMASVLLNLRTNSLMEGGQLTAATANLLIVGMYAVILVVYAAKQWHDRRTAPEDEEV